LVIYIYDHIFVNVVVLFATSGCMGHSLLNYKLIPTQSSVTRILLEQKHS